MSVGPEIDVGLPRSVEAPTLARRELARLNRALSPARLSEARLLVSELVTNALMHARRGGEIRLVVAIVANERLRIEVHDLGPGFARPRPPTRPHAGQEHGRGLYLIDQLAERWGSARTRSGHCVWLELRRR
jgi:anti-sigma regulatory factor (Ser/Thr protein kinase)